jgi:DNA polymerase II large subunit
MMKLSGMRAMIWFVSWRVKMNNYFEDLRRRVDEEYDVANRARGLGKDLVDNVEISLATSLAERAVSLVVTVYPDLPVGKIRDRILELEEKYGRLDAMVSFVVAREIAEEKFCKFSDKLEGIDIGIRVGFAYMTLGVVASPIEGYTGLRLGKTKKGEDYFIASFSGPIRSAGTTATCMVLMLIDYLRENFGYAKYDASEDEVKRYVVENTDFHEKVSNLAYFPTVEEMEFLAARLPIQIDGDPTDQREVSNCKDLPRVNTNFIRGGMCLIFSEGLAQKSEKALGRLKSCKRNGLKCTGFDWLEDYLVVHKKRERGDKDLVATYIKDIVAGRPVYGYPSRSGGFRFRYGRSRTSGFSAVSIHPATMGISNGFLSNGTQLKIEKPTKGCIATSCDSIDGPIVRLKDGSVKRVSNFEEAKNLWEQLDEVIYLGDILFPLGDVIDRNFDLLKPGYVEEWWESEVVEKGGIVPDSKNVSFKEAVDFSRELSIPLHPYFIFYWTQISREDFSGLVKWINGSVWREEKLILPWSDSVREEFALGKNALEILGVEHSVVLDNVVLEGDAGALLFNLGVKGLCDGDILKVRMDEINEGSVLDVVNSMCEFEIKDKAGSFIGARMGRPEKAKLRDLTGSPNVLFPVGEQGGRLKSVQDAVSAGFVKSDFPIYRCECGNEGVYPICEKCGAKMKRFVFCRECREAKEKDCKFHKDCFKFSNRKVDVATYFSSAVSDLGYEDYEVPPTVKGVDKMSSDGRDIENLAKGVLRAKFNLSVNKDGTIRYDATEIPLTHFKPIEIRTSVGKLRELGYKRDINGSDLVDENQILELMPHDIVLPSCGEGKDEKADDAFFNIANFVDEELGRFYKLPRYYNLNSKADLVGQLVACMAPHNCASVVGRIIGFTEMQGLLASPYMHAAMRRDCDGDEASVMLLMDVLLNFSRKFLPSHRGGSQDAPLVLNTRIRAGEVDDQILSFECCSKYPLELYRLAELGAHSSEIKIDNVWGRLKSGRDPFVGAGFTHDTSNLNSGNNNGAYKTLPSMKEKVAAQMELVKKIRAVDTDDVARLILERHFIRDIRGNLRKFCKQQFRCSGCNRKFRRIPMRGSCDKCDGKIIFTISEGSVKKYLEPAMELVRDYNISGYTRENMELLNEYVGSVFGKDVEQMRL